MKVIDLSLKKKAVDLAKNWFGITELKQFQEEALVGILSGRDVFIAQPTGSGKSVVFQLAPFALDYEESLIQNSSKVKFSSQVLIIQPLISLMEDQINSLKRLSEKIRKNIAAGRLLHEKGDLNRKPGQPENKMSVKDLAKEVLDKKQNIIFASPEAIIETHCTLLRSKQLNIKLIAVDEAHVVIKW